MKIQEIEINKIKAYAKNPRKNEPAVEAVAKSLQEFGWKQPLVVDPATMEIVVGHTRWKAAKKLGMKTVPCLMADDLTEEQIKAYRLADNKTNELAEWDFDLLDEELDGILDIDMTDFGFDWEDEYEKRKKEFEERMEAGELSEDDEEYQAFLAKFEAKKTTDDCYTPPLVYEAVADYVAEKYGLDKKNFVRPFVPQGDYINEKYKKTDIVVDNPPFSLMSEIIKYYSEHNIKFFLFAPHLTIFNSAVATSASSIICGYSVTYENGANVSTSFVTNLEKCVFRSAPKLYQMLKKANEESLKLRKKTLPKYNYPLNVVLAPMLTPYSRYGIEFCVNKNECAFVRQLDYQKASGKVLFGCGFLISNTKAAEREKAEREKAEREKAEREKAESWELSARELEIISKLE